MIKAMVRFSVFAVILTVASWQHVEAQQFSPIRARLVVPDSEVLPGVPFEMWIEVRNPSDTAVTLGAHHVAR